MTTRFIATELDLSRLPAPELIRNVDFEEILAATKANFVETMNEFLAPIGEVYDVADLETDPFIIVLQEYAHRETLDLQAINDAARARLLAFARGAYLEQIAAMFGVVRMDGELDDRLRRRVQLAPGAFTTAGSADAYVFHAMTADLRVEDVVPLNHAVPGIRPGEVHAVILTPDETADDVLDNVARRLLDRAIKPMTDIIRIRRARPTRFTIKAVIEVPRGPDPSVARLEALKRLDLYLASRRRVGALIANSGLDAALHVGAAERIRWISTTADVDPGPDGVAVVEAIDLKTEIVGGL